MNKASLIEPGRRVSPGELAESLDLALLRRKMERNPEFIRTVPIELREQVIEGVWFGLSSLVTMPQAAHNMDAGFTLETHRPDFTRIDRAFNRLRQQGVVSLFLGGAIGGAVVNLMVSLRQEDAAKVIPPIIALFGLGLSVLYEFKNRGK